MASTKFTQSSQSNYFQYGAYQPGESSMYRIALGNVFFERGTNVWKKKSVRSMSHRSWFQLILARVIFNSHNLPTILPSCWCTSQMTTHMALSGGWETATMDTFVTCTDLLTRPAYFSNETHFWFLKNKNTFDLMSFVIQKMHCLYLLFGCIMIVSLFTVGILLLSHINFTASGSCLTTRHIVTYANCVTANAFYCCCFSLQRY